MTGPVDDAVRVSVLDRARAETPDVLDELVAETRDFTPAQAAERLGELAAFTRLSGRQRVEQALLAQHVSAAARAMSAVRSGDTSLFDQPRTSPDVPPGTPAGGQRSRRAAPGGRLADRACRVLDQLHGRGLPSHAADVCDTLIRSPRGAGDGTGAARDLAQRWVAVAGSPEYERAFLALIRDPVAGGAELDEAERAAWRAGRAVQNALGETGGGQFLVPVVIDPTIMLSSAGSNNALRRVARVEQITTNQWLGVASAGATSEWIAEGAEAADASPALTQPVVPAFKGDSFVPYSVEWEGDAMDALGELQKVLADAATLLRNTAYTVGTGTTQPSGIIPGATAVSQLPTGAFTPASVFQLQNGLPPRFSSTASWMGNIAVSNAIQQMVTTAGSLLFPSMQADPQRLAGKPWNELSDMSADMATAGSKYLLYGSFTDSFLIADRIGSSMEIVQHLVGTNRRPTGQRGAYLWFRTGSAAILPAAMRVLVKA
jgi:HK97 family phage major capsid protein